MQKRIVSFVPLHDNNAYIARMQELISNYAEIRPLISIKKALLSFFLKWERPYDVVWFNFEENKILNNDGKINLKVSVKLLFKTYLISSLSNKSVFIRHNHYPHKTHLKSIRAAKKLVDLYEKIFDVVITHSGAETFNHKIYCPHPLYKVTEDYSKAHLNIPQEYFLVFGRIVPYKKIEQLVEKFPRNEVIVVAGAVGDETYAKQISNIQHPNLIFMPGYLSEVESQQLVRNSRAVIISHADKDMIVSGSFFYALSVHTPVIAMETAFFKWVQKILPFGVLTVAAKMEDISSIVKDFKSLEFDHECQNKILSEFGDQQILNVLKHVLSFDE